MYSSNSRSRFVPRAVASILCLVAALPGLALAVLNEEQKLAPTAIPGANAGTSSAILGDTAVVGAPGDTGDVLTCAVGGGAAYVYTRVGTLWSKAATLCASDGALGDGFGTSVSISGGNIAVGAPNRSSNLGGVYVYSGSGATWTENATILTAGAQTGGKLGSSVSIQGFTVAAGAPRTSVNNKADVGVTIVYTSSNSGANWTNTCFRPNRGQARTGSLFGTAVSLVDSTILVGAPGYHTGNKQNSGGIFVFVNNGSIWTQQANLRPANIAGLFSGAAVSLFQDTAAFGAPGASNGKGSVYVYQRTGTAWANTATVSVPGGANGDNFGSSVAIQGSPSSILAAGAPNANTSAGAAYEFGSSGGPYSLINQLVASASDTIAGDKFGSSASFDTGRIVIGAPFNGLTAGAAYVFKVQLESATEITGIVNDGDFATDSLTGVGYDVFVKVSDLNGTGTPTGSVHIDDGNGGSCDADLTASGDLDGHAVGSCQITSSFFGSLTINASYGGDLTYSSSTDSHAHKVSGNHFVFNPVTPPNVLQGTEATGVVVELRDGADALINDSTTQVVVTVQNTCGDTITIGTLTLTNGVADFSGLGPKFYTVTSNGALSFTAQESPFDLNTSPSSATSGNFDVDSNAVADGGDIVFADGFEECRL